MLQLHDPRPASPTVLKHFAAYRVVWSFIRDQVGTMVDLHRRHGAMVVLRGRVPWRLRAPQVVLASGAECTRQVLTELESFQSGPLSIRGPRGSALNRMRRGLIGINGEKHREQRRLLTPFFMPKAVRERYPKFVEIVRSELDAWPVGETVNILSLISRISLLVSTQNLLSGGDVADAANVAELTAKCVQAAFSKGPYLIPFNLPGTPYRRLLKDTQQLEDGLMAMAARRQSSADDSLHLLDQLVSFHRADPERMSLQDVVGQVVVLFMASHETVSLAVTWCLFLLSQHPTIMGELLEEIQGRCGDEPPSLEALEDLPLLDAVTKETLRLFPPGAWVPRYVKAETELAGFPVYPGDAVVLGHYVTHRDPEVFSDPNQFRPERWFGAAPDTYAFVPFSAGPRTCIGKTLGTTTIKMVLAMVVQRFRLRIAPNSRIDRRVVITLSPKFGMPMSIDSQDKKFQAVPFNGNVNQMIDLSRTDASTRGGALLLPFRKQPAKHLRRAA
jgi:cytochrome P450